MNRGVPQTRSRLRAALIGGLILALGVVASTFLAAEWRSSVLDSNKTSFDSTAADVSGALSAKLNTNIGLTRTMRARAAMGTQDGESGFLQWYQELQRGSPAPPAPAAGQRRLVDDHDPARPLDAVEHRRRRRNRGRLRLGNRSHPARHFSLCKYNSNKTLSHGR